VSHFPFLLKDNLPVTSSIFLIEVESTADPAFAVNAAGKICAWNRAAVELFGLSEAEALGVSCHEVVQCSDDKDTLCSEQCVIEKAARDSSPLVNFDLRVKTKTGRVWCNLTILIAREAGSGERYAILIVRPRELRKRLEQALSEFVRTQAKIGRDGSPKARMPPINFGLTAREVEFLKRMAKGHVTKAIASQLSISSATVNNHIKHLLTKLDAHTRLEAIRHAENVGVI
jgi:PAS domain S-box-containing protein